MGLFRCWSEMCLLCSLRVSLPFLSYWGWYGKAICGASERAAQLPAPLRQGLTAETSEQAGGQGSLLSDGYFLLTLIDRRQSPPTVCHIWAKWITDKSAGANCPTDLTTSLRPQCSQVTSAWHCITAAATRNNSKYEMLETKKSLMSGILSGGTQWYLSSVNSSVSIVYKLHMRW